MASKIKKKISKVKSLSIEEFLDLDNLEGFVVESEEGVTDVTNLLKELSGVYVTLPIREKSDVDLDPNEPFEEEVSLNE